MKVKIQHWSYESGAVPDYTFEPFILPSVVPRGYYCWVFCESIDVPEFTNWIKNNIKGNHSAEYRFNSGDPMFTVFIQDADDATRFKLTWM
jgi:hypothetical protein